MVSSGGTVAFRVDVEHRDVSHEARRRGAMPVVLARLEEHTVAGADDLDRPAATLGQADAFGDEDGLAVGMRVPRRAGPGVKWTLLTVRRVGSAGVASVSTYTAPVNHSLDPFVVWMSLLRVTFIGTECTRSIRD